MTTTAFKSTVALGALTGMRSMAGPATLVFREGGAMKGVMGVLAAAEMVADKTAAVGNRTDPVPLAGRALMGGVVGGVIARNHRTNLLLGGLLGAAAAVIAAHLAFQLRTRLPVSSALGGVVEDALVIGLGSWAASGLQTHS